MKSAAILLAVLPLGLFAQPALAQQSGPLRTEDPRPMQELDPTDGSDRSDDETFAARPVGARLAMARYGTCVADRSPGKAAEALAMDFTTPAYRTKLRLLSDNNGSCFGRRGRMRGSNLLFAGAIAERLLARDTSAPLKIRLARAAQGTSYTPHSPTDAMAVCLVRSLPDQVAMLLSTEVGSDAETTALNQLTPFVSRCGQGQNFQITPDGLRAILATAAFRTVAGAAAKTKS